MEPTREQAWETLTRYTKAEPLLRHALAVEAGVRAYARRFGEDEERWAVTGIVHDLDYERYPDLETGHPRHAMKLLEEMDVHPHWIRAIASHADFLGVSRDSPMEKTLYAVDELTGFITACALVYGKSLSNVTPQRVRKKLKDKAFARGVVREDILTSFEEYAGDPDEHVQFVIDALRPVAGDLGLEP